MTSYLKLLFTLHLKTLQLYPENLHINKEEKGLYMILLLRIWFVWDFSDGKNLADYNLYKFSV